MERGRLSNHTGGLSGRPGCGALVSTCSPSRLGTRERMDSQTHWWFGADRKWRRGDPPRGWWQAANRRWHPPDDPPDDASQTPPRHMATTVDGDLLTAHDESPDREAWNRVGVPVALGVLVLVVAAIGILWARSAISIQDQPGSRPSGGSGQQDGATTPTTADELQLTDPSDENDASPADRPATEVDGSTSDEPTSTASPAPTSTAGSESPVTTRGGPAAGAPDSTTGGRSDDCPPWVPPGQPAHPIAPDRANRACD